MNAQSFEYTSYSYASDSRTLTLTYTMKFSDADPIVFVEHVQFPAHDGMIAYPDPVLDRAFESVHLMLGISYYKTYLPSRVEVPYALRRGQADFWNSVYRKGLGEFLYRNRLDPEAVAEFPSRGEKIRPLERNQVGDGILVGIGGGKDSIVVAELLREAGYKPDTFFVQYQKKSPPSVDAVAHASGLDHLRLVRVLDPKLSGNMPASYNGHIPASGIFAILGIAAAVLYGHRYIVVGNEYSSNFGNIEYKGMTVNHQWSKSQEFEDLFASYIRRYITPDISYFSLLRPFYEYRIVGMFARHTRYFPSFTSCNRNFTVDAGSNTSRWCGRCAKCAFMFLMLAAHLPRAQVLGIFGTDMFADPTLEPVFRDVLGLGSMKPFDCVGTFDEAAFALGEAASKWSDSPLVAKLTAEAKVSEDARTDIMRTHVSPNIPARFAFIGMRNALILGYGIEGEVTKRFLERMYPNLTIGIADKAQNPDYLSMQDGYNIAVKTPGLPKENVYIHYTTATNIFFSRVSRNMTIGVTGTKGKSTTASLIHTILKEAGRDVRLAGNIGAPMLGALEPDYTDDTVFVVELSSYQLDDAQYSPKIALYLNLFPEHMDYHGSVEKYYAAKDAIYRYQRPSDVLVYNPGSQPVADRVADAVSRLVPFADPLPMSEAQIPLLGEHNKDNVRAAVAVARQMGIDDEVICRAVSSFAPLPHRLQNIGTYDGITFYDDAISTTPESTIAALRALPDTNTIFLGGEDRGYDFALLEQEIINSNVEHVVLFPDTGKRMFTTRPSRISFLETSNMKEAVEYAYKHTKKDMICLLSTASPSYTLWKNFEEKGDEFTQWVRSQPRHAS